MIAIVLQTSDRLLINFALSWTCTENAGTVLRPKKREECKEVGFDLYNFAINFWKA